jgi:hypothetical protein
MATAPILEVVEPGTDIVEAVAQNPGLVLLDQGKRDAFYDRLKAETDKHVPDLTTDKGRKEIASLAFKVTRTKTAIDAARKQLTEDWRTKTSQANAAGKEITDRLDALAADVRRPLTEWETAEKTRVAECQAVIQRLRDAAVVTIDDTSADIRARGAEIFDIMIDEDRFQDLYAVADTLKAATIKSLTEAMRRLKREEEERAELEALRAQNAERERIAEEQRLAREAAEKTEREAKEAKAARIAAEQAEADRIKQAEEAAATRAREEAEAAAQAERDKIAAEQQALVDAANERARLAEEAAQAERDRVAEVDRQRNLSAEAIDFCRKAGNGVINGQSQSCETLITALDSIRANLDRYGDFAADVDLARTEALARVHEVKREVEIKAAQRRAEADKALQRRLKTEAKDAIMSCGVSEEAAQKIVLAIRAREIPHIHWAAQLPEQEA